MKFNSVVLFGGTGFVGSHFARYLLERNLAQKCILADLQPIRMALIPEGIRNQVVYCQVDVRYPIVVNDHLLKPDLIVNLAAIHREPGHELNEYFETNLKGAENVCTFAEETSCKNIIFTSSIAPYGPSDEKKSEFSIPTPKSAYGTSKLVAEKIHLAWLNGEEGRRLLIVRPGVVFGPGEGGNVTRLIRAVLGRYFFYMGNKNVRKAGGYVKELCHAMWWVLERMGIKGQPMVLFNFTMDPPPSLNDYVKAICSVSGKKRFIPSLPYMLILGIAWIVSVIAYPLGISHPFSPVRVRKLISPNWIDPIYLREQKYPQQFGLLEAFNDWRSECPQDWGES
jgi:GlcNAc-P-P-Und epimerase